MRHDFVRALLVAPHPDDEVLGAGIWLQRYCARELHVVHLTDGSPLDSPGREQYAEVRRRELRAALDMVPVPEQRRVQFPFIDKESWRDLESLVEALDALVCRLQPEIVLTPAYEGGHPDHDAAAFAAAAVARRRPLLEVCEFPLYHAAENGDMIAGEFVCGEGGTVMEPAPREYEQKVRMLACFRSQAEFLIRFPVRSERFRRAPAYDFTQPPHPGPLLYERWGWGIEGELWRESARGAYARL